MNVKWSINPYMPFCAEEHIFNKVKNNLVISCGFCRSKHGTYKLNGFSNITCSYDLKTKKWTRIANFPSSGRQGARSVVVNDELYCWGGWKYSPMPAAYLKKIGISKWPGKKGCLTFDDGYKLSYDNNTWKWTKLPNLPYTLTNFCVSAKGTKIYVCTGSICDPKYGQLSTEIENVGSRLIMMDISEKNLSWKELKQFPGKPRMNAVSFIKDDYLYIIGGIYSNYFWKYGDKYDRYMSILDNWKYDIKNDEWERLADNPFALTCFSSSNNIIYDNKAILFGSPYRMSSVINRKLVPNNSSEVIDLKIQKGKNYGYHRFKTCGIVITYDIENDKFEKSDMRNIYNINLPGYQIYDNIIYSTGGEVTGPESNSKCKGPHTNLFVTGVITSIISEI